MDTLNGRKIAAFFLEKMRIIAYHDVAKNVQKKEQSCLVCDDLLKQTYNKISFKERKPQKIFYRGAIVQYITKNKNITI